jgi:hypothetical protein
MAEVWKFCMFCDDKVASGSWCQGQSDKQKGDGTLFCFIQTRPSVPCELPSNFCSVFNKLSFPFINLVELSSPERSCFLQRGCLQFTRRWYRELDVPRGLCLRPANLLQVLISRAGYHITTALSIRILRASYEHFSLNCKTLLFRKLSCNGLDSSVGIWTT